MRLASRSAPRRASSRELWRARAYPGVTPISRKLLQHWADPGREDRMLFCQREAAETAIFLALALALAGFCFWWLGRRRT